MSKYGELGTETCRMSQKVVDSLNTNRGNIEFCIVPRMYGTNMLVW